MAEKLSIRGNQHSCARPGILSRWLSPQSEPFDSGFKTQRRTLAVVVLTRHRESNARYRSRAPAALRWACAKCCRL